MLILPHIRLIVVITRPTSGKFGKTIWNSPELFVLEYWLILHCLAGSGYIIPLRIQLFLF